VHELNPKIEFVTGVFLSSIKWRWLRFGVSRSVSKLALLHRGTDASLSGTGDV